MAILFSYLCILIFSFTYFSGKKRNACHYKRPDTIKINKAEITTVNMLLIILPFCWSIYGKHITKVGCFCSHSLFIISALLRYNWHIKEMAMLVEDITTNNCYYSASLQERKVGGGEGSWLWKLFLLSCLIQRKIPFCQAMTKRPSVLPGVCSFPGKHQQVGLQDH